MLRRPDHVTGESERPSVPETAFPPLEPAFALEERPFGVRFYKGRASVLHPYALLQTARLEDDRLTLIYVGAEVTLTGRGLHALYVHLASQRLARVVEQGERCAAAVEGPVHVARIEEIRK
jgi:hypothetical protein